MAGTIIITGANGSLAIPAVQHLLANYPNHTLVLTVRNTSDAGVTTNGLRWLIKQFPEADSSIRELDLANLLAVHDSATTIATEMDDGKVLPLASIVCNAYYCNTTGEVESTSDGYEKTFQVTYIAHTALVLRLLGSFRSSGGRIVLFFSDAY